MGLCSVVCVLCSGRPFLNTGQRSALILLLFLLPALVTRGGEPWPTYPGGENLRGVSAQTLPDKPVLRWRFQAGAPVYNTPVFDGTQVYFSDTRGTVYALDVQGREVWRRRFTRTHFLGELVGTLDHLRCQDESLEQPIEVFNRPISIRLSGRNKERFNL